MQMKKIYKTVLLAMVSSAFMSMAVYAGEWKQEGDQWKYLGDSGNYVTGWQWIEGSNYCFSDDGILYTNTTTPDGYTVNAKGEWEKHGVVQDKIPEVGQNTHLGDLQYPTEHLKKYFCLDWLGYGTFKSNTNNLFFTHPEYNDLVDAKYEYRGAFVHVMDQAVEHRDVYELQENMPYREMAALIRMSGAELGKLGPQSDNPDELRSEEESKALEAEIRKFLNSFDWVNASDYEKAVRIARRVNQAEYSNTTENCSYAYGCLVEGKASCSGMTGASEVLAMCVNLPVASVVLGFAAHAYPIYCIDGVWFEHEPTSDSTLFKEFYPEDVLQKAGNSIIYLPIYAYCERTGYVAPTNEELEKKFPYNPYRTNARFILAWR